MTTPPKEEPREPTPAPEIVDIAESERRVKRGCFMSLLVLLSMLFVTTSQFGVTTMTLVLGLLAGFVIAILVLINLPGKRKT